LARVPIKVVIGNGRGGGSGAGGARIGSTLVTRGFGRNQSIVAQGFSFMTAVGQILTRFIELGQSGTKRALREIQEVVVWAKLIRVNNKTPESPIQGFVKIKLSDASQIAVRAVKKVSVKVRSIFDDLKITVNRLK